mgnify:CR=1 FL=1
MSENATAVWKERLSVKRQILTVVVVVLAVLFGYWYQQPSGVKVFTPGPVIPVISQLDLQETSPAFDRADLARWHFLTVVSKELSNGAEFLDGFKSDPADRLEPSPTPVATSDSSPEVQMTYSQLTAFLVAGDILYDGELDGTGVELDIHSSVDGVGGSSAGLIYTLAILDASTGCDLMGPRMVSGTGTILRNGNVGLVAGAKQKAISAVEAGVEIFVVPTELLPEVQEFSADMEIHPVNHLYDALEVLDGNNCFSLR